MKKYLTEYEAIIDLHERGYCQDFQLYGNDLLWVQKKIFVCAGEFSILEYHRFFNQYIKKSEMMVIGVIAINYNVKGILINHYYSDDMKSPPLIKEKNLKLLLQPASNYTDQHRVTQSR
jgi:hypothetical protein